MVRPEKVKVVDETRSIIDESSIAIVADYRGTNVTKLNELRNKLRESDTVCKVLKNTLVKIALTEAKVPFNEELFVGPSIFIFGKSDPVTPAKVLADFAKNNEFFKVKGGFLDKKQITIADIKNLASLPNREQLIAQVIGTMNAPIRGLVTVLSGPMRNFANVIEAIRKQKEDGNQ
ncbi:MAG: 50S ribosomal protein L10 [Candidatus Margulisiibacteriota bacterium]|nr:MAG: 50S ribosomal protein L10 [Candidatus Margulisbacteria bacterium GWD2_39_127]OGI04650.1 MAG: 50S ribosomal protein L10 [Candidatus Margulisbacteria bacterium GWF2_38_17]OGI11818.1 MAG: 50S ribosomal protein L10 [Candidatus Margulisbacteria bacterium GWE2_39_32]PZM79809.1 MAG: 50S ribosomal protein L10 [Candidatus Margulisiibacteriota bacterium]HAR62717.1 50S ribosomal protein L10 [Candidatus Margulisiibacteriota bacterium]